MTDELGDNEQNEQSEEMDDIDQFLRSLHIPDEMVNDDEKPIATLRTKPPVTLANIFPLLAWVIFVIAMVTILQSTPPNSSFFNALLSTPTARVWDTQLLFAAMCYLFANCVVCAGGVVIRMIKKLGLNSVGTINLLVVAALSAAISVALLIRR